MKKIVMLCVFLLLAGNTLMAYGEETCSSACFRSPQYYWLNLEQVGARVGNRDAAVVIGGINFNQPISVGENLDLIRHFLQGSAFPGLAPATPLARLNQEFLAAQLSLALAGGAGSAKATTALNGQLQCYEGMISFRPAVLSNGSAIMHFSTLGDLFDQALLAIRENRTADMDALASLFNLLNGNDPAGNCFSTAKPPIRVPQDYATIQDAVNAAKPGDVIRVGKGEFRGAIVDKPVTLIGEGSQTRITSGVNVLPQGPDPGFPLFGFVGFLVRTGGSGATISNFRIELTMAPAPPNPILAQGVSLRRANDVTVIHNEVVGPGPASIFSFVAVYMLGSSRCIVAYNRGDATLNGIAIAADPFFPLPCMNNQFVHNRMVNMDMGIGLRLQAMDPAQGFGPEQMIQFNTFADNFVQGNVGVVLLDTSGVLRDFIRDNNFIRNDLRQCAKPLNESARGMAAKNKFSGNLGL